MNEIWFKRKKYGWGWTPKNWKGWTVIAVYVILLSSYPIYQKYIDQEFSVYVLLAISIFLTATLIGICFFRGEKPKWQWGDKS